ncbi:PD40 domain-containing protein [Sphingomonas sp. dw_22]|uniref:TolB family protein n=1 Tax=Sphingomonas sp. dw_22 TaxID=2721175 RepID=UPI001BD5C7D5|nr:PD40 domain-containing protein [Sphingomonas sp. dw_22]
MKRFLAALVLLAAPAAAQTIGDFQNHGDIGVTSTAGSATFDGGSYRIAASGANIWGTADAFHYAWTRASGDLHIAADIAWEGKGTDPHRKAGLMIRQHITPGSPYADVMVHGDGMVSLQYREVQDGPTFQIVSATWHPRRVRLEREGDYVWFSVAGEDGVLRHAGGNYRIAFQAPYFVGLAVSAHNDAVTETARFSNVELTVPSLAYVPDTGYPAKVESSLEVMDVGGIRSRRIVRTFDSRIEAPNWTRDGKALVYNAGGRIWRIPVEGGEPVAIDTGPNVKNNNDHGLSPDGRQLVISDQSEPDGLSRIFVLPLAGSARPRELVSNPQARSYWHAWTPDGKTIAYAHVGASDGSYDIWSRALAGGPEVPLVIGPGVDDGPEYSPDGKWLYFNSTRSGAMQIWRVRADGSNPEQVTTDPNFRDWFPHFSPDGKWIAFISFGLDVALGDHPPNRDVMLRIMPADGSAPPRVLTRLFGGQGTINVPSWSPDSKSVAFVSYRLVR